MHASLVHGWHGLLHGQNTLFEEKYIAPSIDIQIIFGGFQLMISSPAVSRSDGLLKSRNLFENEFSQYLDFKYCYLSFHKVFVKLK